MTPTRECAVSAGCEPPTRKEGLETERETDGSATGRERERRRGGIADMDFSHLYALLGYCVGTISMVILRVLVLVWDVHSPGDFLSTFLGDITAVIACIAQVRQTIGHSHDWKPQIPLRISSISYGTILGVTMSESVLNSYRVESCPPYGHLASSAGLLLFHLEQVKGTPAYDQAKPFLMISTVVNLAGLVWSLYCWRRQPSAGQLAPGLILLVGLQCMNLWHLQEKDKSIVSRSAKKMNSALSGALSVFFTSLPESATEYVTQPTQVDPDKAERERSGARERERQKLRESSQFWEATSETDCTDYEVDSMTLDRAASQGPGLIHTEDDVVIAFLGVVPVAEQVPAARYLKDLILLMRLVDSLILDTSQIQKIKGAEGFVILRCGGADSIPEEVEADREGAAFHCRHMCMFALYTTMAVQYLKRQGYWLDTIASIRVGITCGP
ncbi:hypothetical protein KIPB_006624, partial [Kipferlia bialata]|eukprot:g6624.t1